MNLGDPYVFLWKKDKAGQSERGEEGLRDMRESDRLILEV